MANCQDESSSETGLEASFENLFSERKSSSSRTDELNTSESSLPSHRLPSNISNWHMKDLEAVGVYYDSEFKSISAILDMIHNNIGIFAPLTETQKERVKRCQDDITIASSFNEIFLTGHPMADLCLKKITLHLKLRVRDKTHFLSVEEDFIRNIVVMVKQAVEKDEVKTNVTRTVFVDLFKSFVKMCGLIPISGDEWRSRKIILHQEITPAADVVIQSEDYLDYNTGYKTAVSVVSVVEAKNMIYQTTSNSKTANNTTEDNQKANERLLNMTSSKEGNHIYSEEPQIFKRVAKRVLAQHGGELLLHCSIYSSKYIDEQRKCYLLPGMIVIGTQVIFTLLEYNFDHLREVENSSVVEFSRSYIYYSEPKDLLKKEDRDLLIESLARLCNST